MAAEFEWNYFSWSNLLDLLLFHADQEKLAKFTSDYVFIKNDKLGYLAGLFLLIVTAAATILGIAPQDIKNLVATGGMN